MSDDGRYEDLRVDIHELKRGRSRSVLRRLARTLYELSEYVARLADAVAEHTGRVATRLDAIEERVTRLEAPRTPQTEDEAV